MKVKIDQINISDELEIEKTTLLEVNTNDPKEIIKYLELPNKFEYTEDR